MNASARMIPAAADPFAAFDTSSPEFENALVYVEKAKIRFADQPEIYNSFLDTMIDFKLHGNTIEDVIASVKTIFKGDEELILEFNQFLPPGYKVEAQSAAPSLAPSVLDPTATGSKKPRRSRRVTSVPYHFDPAAYDRTPTSNVEEQWAHFNRS